MICIIKAIIAWLTMMFVGTNLLGFLVLGLLGTPAMINETTNRVAKFFVHDSKPVATLIIVSGVLTIIYLGALYYFRNILLVVAAVLLMVSRLPDQLWEIRTGKKVTLRNMPKGGIYIATTVVMWLCLPLIWFALCK